jgi:hypothetical protein
MTLRTYYIFFLIKNRGKHLKKRRPQFERFPLKINIFPIVLDILIIKIPKISYAFDFSSFFSESDNRRSDLIAFGLSLNNRKA